MSKQKLDGLASFTIANLGVMNTYTLDVLSNAISTELQERDLEERRILGLDDVGIRQYGPES
jgi:hypothetical protein